MGFQQGGGKTFMQAADDETAPPVINLRQLFPGHPRRELDLSGQIPRLSQAPGGLQLLALPQQQGGATTPPNIPEVLQQPQQQGQIFFTGKPPHEKKVVFLFRPVIPRWGKKPCRDEVSDETYPGPQHGDIVPVDAEDVMTERRRLAQKKMGQPAMPQGVFRTALKIEMQQGNHLESSQAEQGRQPQGGQVVEYYMAYTLALQRPRQAPGVNQPLPPGCRRLHGAGRTGKAARLTGVHPGRKAETVEVVAQLFDINLPAPPYSRRRRIDGHGRFPFHWRRLRRRAMAGRKIQPGRKRMKA